MFVNSQYIEYGSYNNHLLNWFKRLRMWENDAILWTRESRATHPTYCAREIEIHLSLRGT